MPIERSGFLFGVFKAVLIILQVPRSLYGLAVYMYDRRCLQHDVSNFTLAFPMALSIP